MCGLFVCPGVDVPDCESYLVPPVLRKCLRLGLKRDLRFAKIGLYFSLSVIYVTASHGLMKRHDMFITRDSRTC